jgi:hypothetical protein
MGISSSALASLVIAGTAIGGSTLAVMANTAPSDMNSPSISEITTNTQTPILPSEETAPVPIPTVQSPKRIAMPVWPTPAAPLPVITPPPFNLGDDEDDDESGDYEDEDEYGQGGYQDEDDHHHDGDDHEDDEDDEEEDD